MKQGGEGEMKKQGKRRLSIVLSLILAVLAFAGAAPQTKLEAQAASGTKLVWNVFSDNTFFDSSYDKEKVFEMVKNTKYFYLGSYLQVNVKKKNESWFTSDGYLAEKKGAVYKSSNPAVVSIEKNGLVKAKKNGTAKITITYKGGSENCTIRVVSSLGPVSETYQKNQEVKKFEKISEDMVRVYGNGITASNRYQLISLQNLYYGNERERGYGNGTDIDLNSGMENANEKTSQGKVKQVRKVRVPAYAYVKVINANLNRYAVRMNPIGDGTCFKVTKVTGKGSKVTVKLNKKVNEDQIFGIKAASSVVFDSKITKSKSALFPVYVQDKKTGHKYYGTAAATKGKNTLSIQLRSAKLKKGNSYRLVGMQKRERSVSIGSNNSYAYLGFTRKWTDQGKTTFKAK